MISQSGWRGLRGATTGVGLPASTDAPAGRSASMTTSAATTDAVTRSLSS